MAVPQPPSTPPSKALNPVPSDSKILAATAETLRQRRLSSERESLQASRAQTAFAIAHSVGMDGPMNPALADAVTPGRRLSKDLEPVMRKETGEPIGKRLVDEAKEIVGVAREAVGKVFEGLRRASRGEGAIGDRPMLGEEKRDGKENKVFPGEEGGG